MSTPLTRRPGTVACIAILPLMLLAAASVIGGINIPDMTRDVAAIAGLPPLTGILSNLGILAWWSSASIWLFMAALQGARGQQAQRRFALASGLLSAYLGLDDMFQLHESVFPILFHVPEKAVYGLLVLAMATYLLRCWPQIRSKWPLLCAALLCLAASVLADLLEQWLWRIGHWSYFVEDGLKWLGIVAWGTFCFESCMAELGSARRDG
jgi:hypothetical protein